MNLSKLIYQRLHDAFLPTFLEVIDDSAEHQGHVGSQAGGRHFTIKISADFFLNLSRLEKHQKIYDVLKDLMPLPIHALSIRVL